MHAPDPARLANPRCIGTAWVLAWAVAIYLPSLLIAFAGISSYARPLGTGFAHLGATTFAVADEVGPAAKLLLGGLLAVLLLLAHRRAPAVGARGYIRAVAAGVAAMLGALLFVPADYSRGFGIGLTGTRIDPASIGFYLIGGIAAGMAFANAVRRCARR